MNKLLTVLVLLHFSYFINGQNFIKMDTIETPSELSRFLNGNNFRTIHVDFDGDGSKDYICQPVLKTHIIEPYQEIWFNSKFEKIKTVEKYLTDYDFFRFVNIDSDPEPEIFSASGYSDGIDYCFINQDFKNNNDSVMFYFSPVIVNSDKCYWGYPWDISDLSMKHENGLIKIKCLIHHKIIRDDDLIKPYWQNQIPVICFSGYSTQPDISKVKVNKFKWLTISEIIKRVLIN